MRKLHLLKLLLPIGLLSIICALLLGHFTKISPSAEGFLKGLGIIFIVAYVLKASMTKTLWYKVF